MKQQWHTVNNGMWLVLFNSVCTAPLRLTVCWKFQGRSYCNLLLYLTTKNLTDTFTLVLKISGRKCLVSPWLWAWSKQSMILCI